MALIVLEMKGAKQAVWKQKQNLSWFSNTHLFAFLKSSPGLDLKITSIADFQVYPNVLSAMGYMWMHSVC